MSFGLWFASGVAVGFAIMYVSHRYIVSELRFRLGIEQRAVIRWRELAWKLERGGER